MRILFDNKNPYYKTPFGPLAEGQSCLIRLEIPISCKTRTCTLCMNNEDGSPYQHFQLKKEGERENYDIYSCRFSLLNKGLYFYYFRIETMNEAFGLYRQNYDQTNMEEGEMWQLSCIPASFIPPEEYAGEVMYQIFPDRFYREKLCDTNGKIEPFFMQKNLKNIPNYRKNERGEVENCDFFGGNLLGIAKKLPYLADLGVKILYFNPIFKAWSNHRYDTADYKKIDELLGSEEDFKVLCRKAHKLGMKVILDGVFSHTGSKSLYFSDAVSNPHSPYRAWYDFQEYPHTYTSWWGIQTLPCVKETEESFRRFIISDEDSVIAHWLRAGADGFRLDVADELPDAFIKQLRDRIKEIKPDALLIGEVWEDASNKISYGVRRKYFTDGELDSVMNYPFRKAILDFVIGQSTGVDFRNTIMEIAEHYPSQVLSLLMNFLSTHDTPRILSLLSPSSPPADKGERATYRMSDTDREVAVMRYYCASFLQFILPGIPCIYYGDEIGMEGWEDPFCRAFFCWDNTEDNPILLQIKQLTCLRHKYEALRRGNVWVDATDKTVTVSRTYKDKKIVGFINVGEAIEIEKTGKMILSCNIKDKGKKFLVERYGFICFLC